MVSSSLIRRLSTPGTTPRPPRSHRSTAELRPRRPSAPVMSPPTTRTVTFTVSGPIGRDDLPGLSDRVCALLGSHPGTTVLCVVDQVEPDAVTVEALARLQLVAHQNGCQVRLR